MDARTRFFAKNEAYSSQIQVIGETFDFVLEALVLFEIEIVLPMGQARILHPCLRLLILTLAVVIHSKKSKFYFGCGKISFRQKVCLPH